MLHYTNTIIQRGDRVLLGKKKRGYGEGNINGFGGRVEEGETIEEGAVREIREETGLQVRLEDLQKRGRVLLDFEERDIDAYWGHWFCVDLPEGEPQETDEMIPTWYHVDDIPYEHLFEDAKIWMPLLLENKCFNGTIRAVRRTAEVTHVDLKEARPADIK